MYNPDCILAARVFTFTPSPYRYFSGMYFDPSFVESLKQY